MTGSFGEGYTANTARPMNTSNKQAIIDDLIAQTELSHKVVGKIIDILEELPNTGISIDTSDEYLWIKYNQCYFSFTPHSDVDVRFVIKVDVCGKATVLNYNIESKAFRDYIILAHNRYIDKIICAQLFR